MKSSNWYSRLKIAWAFSLSTTSKVSGCTKVKQCLNDVFYPADKWLWNKSQASCFPYRLYQWQIRWEQSVLVHLKDKMHYTPAQIRPQVLLDKQEYSWKRTTDWSPKARGLMCVLAQFKPNNFIWSNYGSAMVKILEILQDSVSMDNGCFEKTNQKKKTL